VYLGIYILHSACSYRNFLINILSPTVVQYLHFYNVQVAKMEFNVFPFPSLEPVSKLKVDFDVKFNFIDIHRQQY
jgi:hypothetical protein